ncbi:hypothetical protein GOBAR_DD14137 [Gossypium barbadense]|nr:hypothetical protein GOBAR_DD14137 [Gossypium barbadense]
MKSRFNPNTGYVLEDKVLGQGTFRSSCDEDFEFLKGNVTKSNVNGIPTMNFSERVQQNLDPHLLETLATVPSHGCGAWILLDSASCKTFALAPASVSVFFVWQIRTLAKPLPWLRLSEQHSSGGAGGGL